MNSVIRSLERAKEQPGRLALWTVEDGAVSFARLLELAARTQRIFRDEGLGTGDHALLAAPPSAGLFAAVLAILGMGGCAVLVEPWMPVNKIDHAVRLVGPKVFFASAMGRL